MSRLTALLLGSVFLMDPAFSQRYADTPKGVDFPSPSIELEAMRSAGNLNEQRIHLWRLFTAITGASGGSTVPVFLTWYGAGEVFAKPSAAAPAAGRGLLRSFSVPGPKGGSRAASSSAPLIIRAHYNAAAYAHIRDNHLEEGTQLSASADHSATSVPAFPRNAVIVKTVWWPVPDEGIVALPIWDPESNPPRRTGNDYLTWHRVVGVSAQPDFGMRTKTVDVEFLGRPFEHVHAVSVDDLYHITLDQGTAESLMMDPETRKVAGLVLGRPLRAKDMVALVALHLATRELEDWVWGTFWWHDRPQQGPYAPPPQPAIRQPWGDYLMSVCFDADLPREADGSPHVAFNPWLEARFPDGGHGGGVASNCIACHQRASTAADRPFLVTRGREEPRRPAGLQKAEPERGAVTTSSLWSLPLQAR